MKKKNSINRVCAMMLVAAFIGAALPTRMVAKEYDVVVDGYCWSDDIEHSLAGYYRCSEGGGCSWVDNRRPKGAYSSCGIVETELE